MELIQENNAINLNVRYEYILKRTE